MEAIAFPFYLKNDCLWYKLLKGRNIFPVVLENYESEIARSCI
jgi:hypothetical protein